MGEMGNFFCPQKTQRGSPAGPGAHRGELVFPETSLPTILDGGSHVTMSHSESGHEWHPKNPKETSLLKEAYQAVDHVASGGHNSMPSKEGRTAEGRDWIGLLAIPIVVLFLWLSSWLFMYLEGYSGRDSLYFCITMLTTVGYGDFSPVTSTGKVFAILYIMVGLSLATTCIGIIFARSADLAARKEAGPVTIPTERDQIMKMGRALGLIVIVNIVGAAWAHFHDGFTWLDAFYWSFITSTSVGFGDLETSDATRNFNIGYMIIAVGVVANGFGTLVEVIGIVGKIQRIEEFCKAGVSNDMIDKMDEDGDSKVDRYEFCTYMLVNLGKIDQDDVDQVMSLFKHYDLDGSGTITIDDVVQINKVEGSTPA